MATLTYISEVTSDSEEYDNVLLMSDFNMTPEIHHLRNFTETNDFENLIIQPTCFKSTSSTAIDLLLTNRKGCFMKSSTNETGISDHKKLICIFLKSICDKGKPKFVYYRCFRNVRRL